jgi:hypothetical protein
MTHRVSMSPFAAELPLLSTALMDTTLPVPALPAPICPPRVESPLPHDAPDREHVLPAGQADAPEDELNDDRLTVELASSDGFMLAHGFRWHAEPLGCFWHHAQTGVRVCREPHFTDEQWRDAKIYALLRALLIEKGVAESPASHGRRTPQQQRHTSEFVVYT